MYRLKASIVITSYSIHYTKLYDAFAKDKVAFAVAGFGQFKEDASAILPAQNIEERNVVEQIVGGRAGPVIS